MNQRLCRLAQLLSLLVLLAPASLFGQEIRGRLMDDESGLPVEGAMVFLLSQGGEEMAVTLSNGSGLFGFRVRRDVRFSLRVERIGYETAVLDVPRASPGRNPTRRILLKRKVISLDSLRVEGRQGCMVRPEEGMVLASLWEEARKALANQDWVARESSRAFEVRRYQRRLDLAERTIESESLEARSVVGSTAIRSLPAPELLQHGFVRPLDGSSAGYVYYGPDASVLLSDEFLGSHCFRLAGAKDEPEGLGIAFEPVRNRDVPDIQGTFFLDPANLHLTALEFEYTWSPAREVRGLARGRVEFEELPDGAWVVREWWIRLPELARSGAPGPVGELVVTGFLVEGEEVLLGPGGGVIRQDLNRGSVEGTVWDSLSLRPLADARVFLSGTEYATRTDSLGGFVLGGVRRGVYNLAFSHAGLDSVGHIPRTVAVRVEPGVVTRATLATPSPRTLWMLQCGGEGGKENTSGISGVVRDFFTLEPVPGASILLEWTDYWSKEGRQYQGDSWQMETISNEKGRFRACGLPPDSPVTVWASQGEEASLERPIQTVGESVSHLDLFLGEPGAREVRPKTPECPGMSYAAGEAAVIGLVSEAATGVPLGRVEVWLTPETGGSPVVVEADGAGRFLFCPLTPGRYTLRAAVRGVGEALAEVEVQPDRAAEQHLDLAFRDPSRIIGQIQGQAVSAEDGMPLSGVRVVLNEGEAERTSRDDGSFSFPDVPMGTVSLKASLLGRVESEGSVILGGGQTLQVQIRLSPQPLELDPIIVEASRIQRDDYLAQVRYRARNGWGTVLLEKEMDVRRSAMKTTDILQEHGATVLPHGRGLFFRRTGCGPVVYIDGVRVTHEPRSGMGSGVTEAAEAVNRISPFWIKAMEIYKGPAQVPGEFLDSNARCGVILIWTQRGG